MTLPRTRGNLHDPLCCCCPLVFTENPSTSSSCIIASDPRGGHQQCATCMQAYSDSIDSAAQWWRNRHLANLSKPSISCLRNIAALVGHTLICWLIYTPILLLPARAVGCRFWKFRCDRMKCPGRSTALICVQRILILYRCYDGCPCPHSNLVCLETTSIFFDDARWLSSIHARTMCFGTEIASLCFSRARRAVITILP